jgi:polar amino acid transport system substrate-binding protein
VPHFPGVRLLDGGFMVIRQAAVISGRRSEAARAALDDYIEWGRTSGFVRDALERHAIEGARIPSNV